MKTLTAILLFGLIPVAAWAGNYQPMMGDTNTGLIKPFGVDFDFTTNNVSGQTPTEDDHLATKEYVDDGDAAGNQILWMDGGTTSALGGPVYYNLSNEVTAARITNSIAATPTNNQYLLSFIATSNLFTRIAAGSQVFVHYHARRTGNPASSLSVKPELYVREADGTETNEIESGGANAWGQTDTEVAGHITITQDVSFISTDRLVIKFKVTAVSGTTGGEFYTGPTAATRVFVPIDSGSFLPITGGTMTGPITYSTAPTAGGHLANKDYVDAQDTSPYATNAVWFGATMSTSNSTFTSLTNAIAVISARGGGTVQMVHGAYAINAEGFTVPRNVRLLGVGEGATILDSTGQAQGDGVIQITGSNVCLEAFNISSDKSGGTSFDQIEGTSAADYITIRNVTLLQSDNHAINIPSGGSYWFIHKTTINSTDKDAIYIAGALPTITDCIIYDPDDQGVNNSTAGRIVVRGCYVYSAGKKGIIGGAYCLIDGNYIRDASLQGITVGQYGVAVNNYIWNSGQDGIYGNGSYLIISHNVMKDGGGNNYADIKMNSGHKSSIIGNMLYSTAGDAEQGIHLDNSDNNIISGTFSTGHDTTGLQIDSDCDNNIVIGNNWQDTTPTIDNSTTTKEGILINWGASRNDGDMLRYSPSDVLFTNDFRIISVWDADTNWLFSISPDAAYTNLIQKTEGTFTNELEDAGL